MSELSLVAALPPEALAPLASAPAAPARPGPAGVPRPDHTSTSPGRDAPSTDPFAALLQGFLASAQPPATGDLPPAPEPESPALVAAADAPATVPVPTALPAPGPAFGPAAGLPGTAPQDPAAGTTLPPAGSELPPLPGSAGPADDQVTGPARDPAAPAPAPAATGSEAPRIFLADLAMGRRLAAGEAGTVRSGDAPAMDGLDLYGSSADPALPGGTEGGDPPASAGQAPAPVPAPMDFARLAVQLAATQGREAPAGGPPVRLDASGSTGNPASGPAAASTATDPALRSVLAGAAGGFPALQPLGDNRAWSEGLGDRLLTLAGPGHHSARLTLHPDSLGPLDVEIRIEDSSAQVWFGTAHAQTREAIESSLPRLREMFADQGITLTRAQVDAGTDGQTRQAPPRPLDLDYNLAAAPLARRADAAFTAAPGASSSGSRRLDVWA